MKTYAKFGVRVIIKKKFLVVPNHPPDFKAVSRTPFTIDVEWKHVSNNTLNGKMYLYYIYYRQLDHSDRQWEVAGTSGTNLTLIDLKPKTLYGMRISVSIEEGNGIASMEKQVWTIEGGKITSLNSISADV